MSTRYWIGNSAMLSRRCQVLIAYMLAAPGLQYLNLIRTEGRDSGFLNAVGWWWADVIATDGCDEACILAAACLTDAVVQIWHTPGVAKVFAPMRLHRTIGSCHDDITALDWSPNSQFIAAACKDLTVR